METTPTKNIILSMIEVGRTELERTARAVPDDKLQWKPLDNGRPILDLLGDAAQSPALCTAILHGNVEYGPEFFQRLAQERSAWSRDDALRHLEENTQRFIEAVSTLPEEKLAEPLTLPMGGGMTLPVGAWLMMAYRSFMSRTAQINYIQTLYGDFDRH